MMSATHSQTVRKILVGGQGKRMNNKANIKYIKMLMRLEPTGRMQWHYLYYIYGFFLQILFQNKVKKYYSTLVLEHYAAFMFPFSWYENKCKNQRMQYQPVC